MSEKKTQRDPVHVDARHAGRQVVLTREDEDRFVLTCRETVSASVGYAVVRDEIVGAMSYVAEWVENEKGCISHCYASPREGRLVFFVSPRCDEYDSDLGEALTRLDIDLAQQFQAASCEVQQIPSNSIDSFLDVADAKDLSPGKGGDSSPEVDAQPETSDSPQ